MQVEHMRCHRDTKTLSACTARVKPHSRAAFPRSGEQDDRGKQQLHARSSFLPNRDREIFPRRQ